MPATPPDVELTAEVRVREVTIAQEGPIRVTLTAQPGVTDVAIARSAPAGARTYRNLTIDARLAAWLTAEGGPQIATEPTPPTGDPQP